MDAMDIWLLLFVRIICDAAAVSFNSRQRPVKVRRMVPVVGEHKDNSGRLQITALSSVKMFLSSQIKQIVLKAVSLETIGCMPNKI